MRIARTTVAAKIHTNNYVTDANYTSRYIRNRLLSSTVTHGSKTVTLVTNSYDEVYSPIADTASIREHDGTYGTSFRFRGSVAANVS